MNYDTVIALQHPQPASLLTPSPYFYFLTSLHNAPHYLRVRKAQHGTRDMRNSCSIHDVVILKRRNNHTRGGGHAFFGTFPEQDEGTAPLSWIDGARDGSLLLLGRNAARCTARAAAGICPQKAPQTGTPAALPVFQAPWR